MHIIQRLFSFLVISFAFLIAGCSSDDSTEKQVIEIQEYDLDGGEYRDLEKITDRNQVQQVREIVRDSKWEETLVNMGRPADYRFIFQYENAGVEAKPVLHELWISASSEKAEMVRGDMEYSQLNEKETADLMDILNGN